MLGEQLPWPLDTLIPWREKKYTWLLALQEAYPAAFTSSWKPISWQIPREVILRKAAMTLALGGEKTSLPAQTFRQVIAIQQRHYGRLPECDGLLGNAASSSKVEDE